MYEYKAIVVRVVDGDTLDLDIDLGMNVHVRERVRLNGIDAPETYGVKKDSHEFMLGMNTKNRLEQLVLNKEVEIATFKDKKGKYGRYIVDMWLDDPFKTINTQLIEEGLAERKKY